MGHYDDYDIYENCWAFGTYNDECECHFCPHQYECSGANTDEDDEEVE